MSKKKQVVMEEVPIDKVENFVEKNFKQILIGVAIVILLVLGGYGLKSYMAKSYANKINELGHLELVLKSGKIDKNSVDLFLEKGEKVSDVKNYVVLKAMQLYAVLGDHNKVKEVSGDLTDKNLELGESLMSDLGIKQVDYKKYFADSYLTPIWYYRAILSAKDKNEAEKYITEFKTKFPDSRLLELIENWELGS
ncbi:conserved hypothetical protein [Deferribacter desulfuricans SSM1]|uniref:Tetratricopeptide repeat-like domain-containing protein n=1 Tax=Deferribacter desulfuricans (strain DSM 14783 / JCM 11476 / NBRC 101012 / SSM1) TaxID=639282 RepID=D3PCD5_DEFDS|nr:hypothetical protein [Deferribacter desulfuricans]BAI80258.1 conserved hypothetical protein [Deferribacter desulfuricans SSM1]